MEREEILIAVPSADGEKIFHGMLGQAPYFYIYRIESNRNYRLLEKRENVYAKTLQHLKTLDVYEEIKDCAVIVSERIGRKGIERLKERGVELIFKKGNIEKAITEIPEDIFPELRK